MSFISCRSRSIIHGFFSRVSSSLSDKKSLLFYSSSSSSSSFSSSGYSEFYSNYSNKESSVYQNALRWRRPPTIEQHEILHSNFVSFIGSLAYPVMKYSDFVYDGVWTVLKVQSPGESIPNFRILLVMRGKLAEISLQHLIQNDFVYVSGRLSCYTKVDSSDRHLLFYKVIVNELNYVKQSGRCQSFQRPETSKPNAVTTSSALDNKMEEKDRLNLWQVFFASPNEWWDNRQTKWNSWSADFKHKDTGERLWISPDDPPWVGKQLQLLDSRIAERGQSYLGGARTRLSVWEYDD